MRILPQCRYAAASARLPLLLPLLLFCPMLLQLLLLLLSMP
jgi:hypothetical protein